MVSYQLYTFTVLFLLFYVTFESLIQCFPLKVIALIVFAHTSSYPHVKCLLQFRQNSIRLYFKARWTVPKTVWPNFETFYLVYIKIQFCLE